MIFTPCLDKIDQNQKTINNLRPLKKRELVRLKEFYNIGLAYSSNAMEGNSLTESETKVVIEDGITIGGKPVKDHLEALGHSDAFNKLYTLLDTPLSETIIKDLHRLFYYRIDEKYAGQYRDMTIMVSGSEFKFPPPNKVPNLMTAFINDLADHKKRCHPVIHASYVHRQFVSIHPFIDGNGRMARLLMNVSLLSQGYPVTIIPPIFRQHYIDALKEFQLTGNEEPFDTFVMNLVLESQKDFIRHFGT